VLDRELADAVVHFVRNLSKESVRLFSDATEHFNVTGNISVEYFGGAVDVSVGRLKEDFSNAGKSRITDMQRKWMI